MAEREKSGSPCPKIAETRNISAVTGNGVLTNPGKTLEFQRFFLKPYFSTLRMLQIFPRFRNFGTGLNRMHRRGAI